MPPTSTPTPITWLRYFRIAAGMTLEALEKASNVSVVSLSRIENQRVTPLPDTQAKIAAVFNVPPDVVFPPAGNRTPMDVLNGWVLMSIRKREETTR